MVSRNEVIEEVGRALKGAAGVGLSQVKDEHTSWPCGTRVRHRGTEVMVVRPCWLRTRVKTGYLPGGSSAAQADAW